MGLDERPGHSEHVETRLGKIQHENHQSVGWFGKRLILLLKCELNQDKVNFSSLEVESLAA